MFLRKLLFTLPVLTVVSLSGGLLAEVAHDHDGDGIADHGQEFHSESESKNDLEEFFDKGIGESEMPVSEVPT